MANSRTNFLILEKLNTMNAVEEILKLSKEERIEIAQTIWDSVELAPDDFPLTIDQLEELRSRRKEYEQGNMPVFTWEEVKESILHSKP